MADEERWPAIQATIMFEKLHKQLVATRKPMFIDGERNSAVLITMEEWNSI